MTAVICFPINGRHAFAKIYRASSEPGVYNLIDTVNARHCEYEDADGDYTSLYKVAFSDGQKDEAQVAVKSLIQQIIENIRIELQVTASVLSDADIYRLFDTCKAEMMLDICVFYYGVQISKITDTIYQLPNRYFFDQNCGGVISTLDFEFFKQITPIYIYSEKTPVNPIYVDPDERYVELAEPLASNEILKVNYYSASRKVRHFILVKLISYKICAAFYGSPFSNSIGQDSTVKIGDITIKTGSSSASKYADSAIKMNARYKQMLTNIKTGFYRAN